MPADAGALLGTLRSPHRRRPSLTASAAFSKQHSPRPETPTLSETRQGLLCHLCCRSLSCASPHRRCRSSRRASTPPRVRVVRRCVVSFSGGRRQGERALSRLCLAWTSLTCTPGTRRGRGRRRRRRRQAGAGLGGPGKGTHTHAPQTDGRATTHAWVTRPTTAAATATTTLYSPHNTTTHSSLLRRRQRLELVLVLALHPPANNTAVVVVVVAVRCLRCWTGIGERNTHA